jgi:hopene-associated glycosyltransferase HpnB
MMLILGLLTAVAWAYLLLCHGRFWQAGPILGTASPYRRPPVAIVVPARDEAASIAACLRSLLAQDYKGDFRVVLVDDGSSDGTGDIARALADPRLTVIPGTDRPPGWAGKLWAVAQGVAAAPEAEYLLLCDADIVHDPRHLNALLAQAERGGYDLVSEMVRLSCDSLAERALVPAFVYFFQMLYPFALVHRSDSRVAAAAGGTMLLRAEALAAIGGIAAIQGALIDDVALAARLKPRGRIWLGHSRFATSIRPYPDAASLWRMIARSAYVQLRYSPPLLLGTVLGMALLWFAPLCLTLFGHGPGRLLGFLAWAAATLSYWPTLRRFGLSMLWSLALPAIAAFYLAATIGSALRHHSGRGVQWKHRAYPGKTL